jgi:hypothetical protein
MYFPVVVERVTSVGRPICHKSFENGTLPVVKEAGSGDVFAGYCREFVLEANGLTDVESGLPGIDRNLEMYIGRIGGDRLAVLRVEYVRAGR